MKILSTEKQGINGVQYWMEDDNGYYVQQLITSDDQIEEITAPVLTSKYDDYEHFAGVMGKFNPYTVFMLKPIAIKKLDFVSVWAVANRFESLQRELEQKEREEEAKNAG